MTNNAVHLVQLVNQPLSCDMLLVSSAREEIGERAPSMNQLDLLNSHNTHSVEELKLKPKKTVIKSLFSRTLITVYVHDVII